jgi:two-component system nitrate/nitrite response regulator NarL
MRKGRHHHPVVPVERDPSEAVATLLLCRNRVLGQGLNSLLSGTRFVVGEEGSEEPALILIAETRASDESIEAIRRMKARYPAARLVMLADQIEPGAAVHLRREGLNGFCLTCMAPEVLLNALELVMLGETFIPAALTSRMLNDAASSGQFDHDASGATAPEQNPTMVLQKLSEREAAILYLLTQGAANKMIAHKLGIAESTVKVHLRAILKKLRARNRTQAALWAQQHLSLVTEKESASTAKQSR